MALKELRGFMVLGAEGVSLGVVGLSIVLRKHRFRV